MEETSSSSPALNPPTSRAPVRRPRPATPRTGRSSASGGTPANIHVYAPWALVAAVAILALAVLGVISVPGQKSEAWQAVFLTNGQMYVGHITRATPNWLTLRDVYYLAASPQGNAASPDFTLVKLGKELHGPEDAMRINRQHVLFTEVLRDDGEVVKAIARVMSASAVSTTAPPPTSDAPAEGAGETSDAPSAGR